MQISDVKKLKTLPDSDDIKYKEIIKKRLLENEAIIYFLNNKELQDAEAPPDEYFGKNIFPYYIVEPTQHNMQNYICYETQVRELKQFDKFRKMQQIIFYVICEERDNIEKSTYIARHDLLAALILDEFNWSYFFGNRIHCISNIPTTVDNDYAVRTLIFEHVTDNNMVKTRNGIPRMVNHEKQYTTEE